MADMINPQTWSAIAKGEPLRGCPVAMNDHRRCEPQGPDKTTLEAEKLSIERERLELEKKRFATFHESLSWYGSDRSSVFWCSMRLVVSGLHHL